MPKRKKRHIISKDKEPDTIRSGKPDTIRSGKPDISSYLDRYPDAVALCEGMDAALMKTVILTITAHLRRTFDNEFISDINTGTIRKAVDLLDETSLKVLLCSLRAIHTHLCDMLVFVIRRFNRDSVSKEMEIVNAVLNQITEKSSECGSGTYELECCWREIRERIYEAQANSDSESIRDLTIGTSPRYIGRVHDIYVSNLREAIRYLPFACRMRNDRLIEEILDDIDEYIRKSKPLFTKDEIARLIAEIRYSCALSPQYESLLNDIDIHQLRPDDYPIIRSGLKYIIQSASKRGGMDVTGATWLQRLQRMSYELD